MNNQLLVLLTQHGNVEIGILLVDNFLVEPNIKFTGGCSVKYTHEP